MLRYIKFSYLLLALLLMINSNSVLAATANTNTTVAILCYHNFNPTVPGSMTLTPERFETQLKWLKDNGYTIIPLATAVEYLQGKRESLPNKPVVITADDGWQSVYTYMVPLVKKYNIPVTLFIYPQTISHGKNAMTWKELSDLQNTGLFDIQSHTYSHPNFKQEKRALTPTAYDQFIDKELVSSKKILEEKLHKKIDFLAWPFGIYNDYLENQAKKAGYVMAFTIGGVVAKKEYAPMAQPRFMILQGLTMKSFARQLSSVH